MKEGWTLKTLGDVCTSKSSNVSQNKLADEDGDFPIYGASGLIKKVSFYHRDKPYLSIVKDGSGFGRVTKVGAFTSVIGTLQYILPKEDVDIDYLNYALMSVDFKKYVAGAAIPHIYFKDYKNEPFLWVPLPEQQRIVSIIDKAFEAIDKAIKNTQKNLQNAKELFESYLQGEFDTGNWETKTIQEITKVLNGYAFASKDFKPTNTVRSVKITNVGVNEFVEEVDNYLPEKFKETLKDFQVKEGNIVIALTRTIIAAGVKVALVPASYNGALVNQRVAALVPIEKLVDRNFLYYYLTTSGVAAYVLKHVNTLMQPNLSINDLKNMPVPFLGLNEQQKIVRKIDALQFETKAIETKYQQKLRDLEELKKSVLNKAFAGEL
jgi:type I restriction enzyme S subunit